MLQQIGYSQVARQLSVERITFNLLVKCDCAVRERDPASASKALGALSQDENIVAVSALKFE